MRAAWFLTAAGISFYGDWLTTVALVVLIYRATGSVTAPAVYILARVAPRVLGPTPGGALADRLGPTRVAAVCNVGQFVLTAAMVLLARDGIIWAIYLVVAAAQFFNALSQPAYSALIPRLVAKDQLGRINGIFNALYGSSILVGPAIGALVLPFAAPEILVAAGAGAFLVSAVMLALLGTSTPAAVPTSPRGIGAGVRVVMQDGMLRSVAAAYLGNAAVVTALQAVLVVAASQQFGHDTDVGWLYAAVGVGGLLASLSFLRKTPTRILRREIIALSVLELAPLAAFAFARNLGLAVALLFLSSLGAVLYQTRGAIGLQQRVATDMLGRANAVIRTALYLGMLIGALAAVALVQPLGWQATILIMCAASFALLAITSLTGPRDPGPSRRRKSRHHVSTSRNHLWP